jgi:predicted transcriptional regulator of viral defense system
LLLIPYVLYHALTMVNSLDNQALRAIGQLGIVRPAQLEANGVSRSRLYRLVRKGLVERHARGVYTVREHVLSAEHTLAVVAKQVPAAVFCLLTALRFH